VASKVIVEKTVDSSECTVHACVSAGNNREWNGVAMVQVENKTEQWFGAALDASAITDSAAAVIVVRSAHFTSSTGV